MNCPKPKLQYLCSEIKHKNKCMESNVLLRENRSSFYKDKTNSDIYINILKRYIPKIKEFVQDPFII